MSRIKINVFISSKNGNNTYIEKDAIRKENSVIYMHDDIKTVILFEEDKVAIKRENEEFSNFLEFIQNKQTDSKYYINSYDKYLNMKIYTKFLYIGDNSLKIKYDLYLEDEKKDEYTFELKWRWNTWI